MASIDIDRLSKMLKEKRGKMNLRDTAKAIGDVSISTLSRVEQGKIPDLSTFLKICAWLGVNPSEFAPDFQQEEENHKKEILYHLRADSTLSKDVASALKQMIEIAYANSEILTKSNGKRV